MVDLMGRYSKRANWTSGLPGPRNITRRARPAAQRARWQPPAQLSDAEADALANDYAAGASVYDLADKYGIHRATVSEHLHRQDIPMRRRGLDPDQARLAAHLYQQGQSLARIGDRLTVDPGTVRACLLAQGIATRDPHGRPRPLPTAHQQLPALGATKASTTR